jgi:hypothetical protein
MKYDLIDPQQATTLMQNLWPKVKTALAAGKKLTLEVKDAGRSNEQNEKFHAIIGDIAKQAKHLGSKWDAEDWKRLLVDKFLRETGFKDSPIIPNLDGTGIVQLGFQTRNFSKEHASEFVEFLLAWCAENGVELKETI